jgi:hypothetical protein
MLRIEPAILGEIRSGEGERDIGIGKDDIRGLLRSHRERRERATEDYGDQHSSHGEAPWFRRRFWTLAQMTATD